MRKLLILGATPFQIPIIKKAQEMGCYVITMDNVPSNPGHKYSDQSANVSTLDYINIAKFCQVNGVSAIVTGGSDVAVPSVGYVCETLGLSGCSYKQALTVTRKDFFRCFQKEAGLNLPEYYVLSEHSDLSCLNLKLSGEYIIKPVDNCGSKGVEELTFPLKSDSQDVVAVFNKTKNFSFCGKVIVEKKINGREYGGDAFLYNGQYVSFVITNKTSTGSPNYVPIGHTVPCDLDLDVQHRIQRDVKIVLDKLGVNSGPVNFDVIIDKGSVFILEMSLRMGGNCIPQVISYATGFDEIESSIRSAFNDKITENIDSQQPIKPTGVRIIRSEKNGILTSLRPVVFFKEKYAQSLKEFVYDYKIGDRIERFVQGNNRIGHFIVASDKLESLLALMSTIEGDIEIGVGESL